MMPSRTRLKWLLGMSCAALLVPAINGTSPIMRRVANNPEPQAAAKPVMPSLGIMAWPIGEYVVSAVDSRSGKTNESLCVPEKSAAAYADRCGQTVWVYRDGDSVFLFQPAKPRPEPKRPWARPAEKKGESPELRVWLINPDGVFHRGDCGFSITVAKALEAPLSESGLCRATRAPSLDWKGDRGRPASLAYSTIPEGIDPGAAAAVWSVANAGLIGAGGYRRIFLPEGVDHPEEIVIEQRIALSAVLGFGNASKYTYFYLKRVD